MKKQFNTKQNKPQQPKQTKPLDPLAQKLSEQLYNHYYYQDTPRADDLVVPPVRIRPLRDMADTYQATITYIVFCPHKKLHQVNVHFQVDEKGNLRKNTLQYA